MAIDRIRRLPLVWLFLMMCLIAPVAGQAQGFDGVTGKTVQMVTAGGAGAFVQVETDRWVEVGNGSVTPAFTFSVSKRSDQGIELYDASRDVRLFMVLETRQIWYQQGQNTPFQLYPITSASAVSKVPWSDRVFDARARRTAEARNQANFIVQEQVFDNEVLLSGDTVQVEVTLFAKETTDSGQDEIVWTLGTPSFQIKRMPAEDWHSMNEDDSEMESWTTSLSAKIDPNDTSKPFQIRVVEIDSGANSNDLIYNLTLQPIVDINDGRISFDTKYTSSENYDLTVKITDSRIPQRQILPIQDIEKSPTVPDVISLLDKASGSASTVVNSHITGLDAGWGEHVNNGDHLQGITMTKSGQLALNMSLTGQPGVFAYSNSIYGLAQGEALKWKFFQTDHNGTSLWHKHPSGMDSTGQIVAVSNKSDPVRFIYLPSNFGDAVHLDHLSNTAHTGEAVGIAYHPQSDRFYATWMWPGVIPSDTRSTQSISIYASTPGLSLLDDTNRFSKIATVAGVPVSGQGISMLVQDNGDIFIASMFNSDNEPSHAEYGPACSTEYLSVTGAAMLTPAGPWLFIAHAAAVAGAADRFPFTDILTTSKIGQVSNGQVDFLTTAEVKIDKKEIGRTQWEQFCVLHRPSWRFGGSFVATGPNEIVSIWGGRWNTITDPLSDAFEYAAQRLR